MSSSLPLHVVILAAGQGTRMVSDLPKVLHPLAGKPMLDWVINAARALNPAKIHLIYGHEGEKLRDLYSKQDLSWVHQAQQLGTGHALAQALPRIPDESRVLVLTGDAPLISTPTLQALLEPTDSGLSLLTAVPADPTGLGRILRNAEQQVIGIVEEKDASVETRAIREIYSGICVAKTHLLKQWLPKINTKNAQKEYYLTDIVRLAREDNIPIQTYTTPDPMEVQGVNTRLQLATLERHFQLQNAQTLLNQGVSIADPYRFDVRGTLHVGRNVVIDVNAIFEGNVSLGDDCRIGPNCVLKNVSLGKGTHILANSLLEEATIGTACTIGPFARLRPGTQLEEQCKIGNFVETKNAHFEAHSKANHLSYLGDVKIGKDVNIGAGTITCNYDGAQKHQTIIEEGAFIGSGTELIAPITIGEYATIGAGSTIREDAAPYALTLTAGKQKSIPKWHRPTKKKE